jgi:hypothetical protein
MSVLEEIRDQQKKAWKEMGWKERLAYFWDYYKIPVIVGVVVIAFIGTFIYQQVNRKDSAFEAAIVNADTYSIDTSSMCEEFAQYAGIDTGEYDVTIDSTISLSDDDTTQMSLANSEKMVVLIQNGSLDVIVADTKVFEGYAQDDVFTNLEEILPAETLEQYKDYLYYTDGATIGVDEEDVVAAAKADDAADSTDSGVETAAGGDAEGTADGSDSTEDAGTTSVDPWEEQTEIDKLVINHHDPSSMKNPVAVGICLPADNKLMQTGCYDYLTDTSVTYQGYPSEAVLGIPITSARQETALQFLEYLR